MILCIGSYKSIIAIQDRCAAWKGIPEAYEGIDLFMAFCVMFFDMLKLRRVLERRHVPIQVSQPLMQRRITRSDITDIALEMLHIHGVEANDGSVQANVCFGDTGTKIVGSSVFGKVSFGAIEGVEEGFEGFFISFLRSTDDGKPAAESRATREMGKQAYVAKPDL